MPDIDIDTQSEFNAQNIFKCSVAASMVKKGELVKHSVGSYFQQISVDPITNLSAIPYKQAEEFGYFKVDFLHLSLLDHFHDKHEIRALLKKEPNWDLMLVPSITTRLFHLANHYDVVQQVKPRSVQEVADILALIRPGKRHLLQVYLADRINTRDELYTHPKENNVAWFKRSHSIAYAHNVVLQLHLISAGVDVYHK